MTAKSLFDEKVEQYTLGQGSELAAKPMLEITPTNRILTDTESKLCVAVRAIALALGDDYKWLADLVDDVEEYQLTIGELKNSRTAFAEVVKAQFSQQSVNEQKKGSLLGL